MRTSTFGKISSRLLGVSLLSACATTQPYHPHGDATLAVVLDGESQFMGSSEAQISFFEDVDKCNQDFLGTLQVDNQETKEVLIPTEKRISYTLKMTGKNIFHGRETHFYAPFFMKGKTGEKYRLTLKVRDGVTTQTLERIQPGKPMVVNALPYGCNVGEQVNE